MARTRTASFSYPGGGSRLYKIGTTTLRNETHVPFSPYVRSVCVDALGRKSDHPLNIEHIDLSGIVPLTGSASAGIYVREYSGWYPDLAQATPVPLIVSEPTDGEVATATLARSNPSRPAISVPLFIYELKDLPGMIRDIGKLHHLVRDLRKVGRAFKPSTARESANLALSYQMGWQPLISDLRKLLKFQQTVDRKVNDLDRLFRKNGGLHRTVGKSNPSKGRKGMWTDVNSARSTVTIDSALGVTVQCRQDTSTAIECWGSCRWNAIYPPDPSISNQELGRLARRLVFGANVSTKLVWDAVPWTWLVDWFSNIGDYLDATNNQIDVFPSVPLVMRHKKTSVSWTRSDSLKGISGGGGTRYLETKSRVASYATLTASFPFLSGRQLSILGELAIQRLR